MCVCVRSFDFMPGELYAGRLDTLGAALGIADKLASWRAGRARPSDESVGGCGASGDGSRIADRRTGVSMCVPERPQSASGL